MNCHQCNGVVGIEDRFCEECGANLLPDASPAEVGNSCQKCGATPEKIDPDRYCNQCGHRQVEVAESMLELEISSSLAGASDIGRRHHRNEDAIALKFIDPQTYILVVCDGVSSSQNPQLASQAAVDACLEGIDIALQSNNATPAQSISQGIERALVAVSAIPIDPFDREEPSSTTIVTAIVRNNLATIGWLGDSRAYWIAETNSQQLTQDDSWMREIVAAGEMTLAQAEESPHAHAIVRWLGADISEEEAKPNLCTFTIPGAGYLLLCTDGLWNYAPDPTDLYHLIQQVNHDSPILIARHLVEYANQQGGQDNITVGILKLLG